MYLVQMFVNANGPVEMPKYAKNVHEERASAEEIKEGMGPEFRQYWLDVADFDVQEICQYFENNPNVIEYWF